MTAVVVTVTAGPATRHAALALVLLLVLLTAHHRPRPTATSDHTTTKGGRGGQDGATTPNQHPPQGPQTSLTPETNGDTMTTKKPAPPKGTGPNGRKLWTDVLEVWEMDTHELALLREAVRTVDQLDALHKITEDEGLVVDAKAGTRVHPALTESRQLRIALARLLAALRLPDGEEGDGSQGRRQRRVGARGTYSLRSAS